MLILINLNIISMFATHYSECRKCIFEKFSHFLYSHD